MQHKLGRTCTCSDSIQISSLVPGMGYAPNVNAIFNWIHQHRKSTTANIYCFILTRSDYSDTRVVHIMTFSTDDSRWQALCQRLPAAHASFIYGVKTTRIFCRPTCAARLARRANVVFFQTASEASEAGFRPCKRCKPSSADEPDLEHHKRDIVRRACDIIRGSEGTVTPAEVAKQVGLSGRYFHGIFKEVIGLTPVQYARHCAQRGGDACLEDAASVPLPLLSDRVPTMLMEKEVWLPGNGAQAPSGAAETTAGIPEFVVPFDHIDLGLDACPPDMEAIFQSPAGVADTTSLPANGNGEPSPSRAGASGDVVGELSPPNSEVYWNHVDQGAGQDMTLHELNWW